MQLSTDDKVYRRGDKYHPLFDKDAAQWRQENSASLDRPTIPLERISSPWRREDDGIIAAIIRSFDQRVPLSVRYQSLTTKEGKRRTICPHHLVDNSNRLHARTWDYERNAFIDLVLTRMSDPELDSAVPWIDGAADRDWNEPLDIDLEPNPALSAGQAEVVMREIGLPPGGGTISVRTAETLYLLEHLGIRGAVQKGVNDPDARIFCTNWDKLLEALHSR